MEARVKERLTGAIILVAVLVLLVPELLTGPESYTPAKPAGAEGAQLRSYTIDLQEDAANRQLSPPTSAAEQPASGATPEPEAESPPVANVSPPVDEATRAAGTPMGSGADSSAAVPDGVASTQSGNGSSTATKPATGAAPRAEDDTPRSAFGPNAHVQPEKPATGARPDTGKSADAAKATAPKADALKAETAKAETAKAEAAKAEVAKAEVAKAEAKKADAAKAEAAKAEAARVAAAKAEATRIAAAKPDSTKPGTRGWAVQLGVFGSRDNAERLARQVRGSGFPVLVNETSGKDGKKLYWVRVGPEAEQAGATALSAKLKAAGHRDARVVAYP